MDSLVATPEEDDDDLLDSLDWDGLIVDDAEQPGVHPSEGQQHLMLSINSQSQESSNDSSTVYEEQDWLDEMELMDVAPTSDYDFEAPLEPSSEVNEEDSEEPNTREYATACLEAFALSFMSQLDDAIPSTEIGSTEGDDEQPSAQTGVFDSVLMELVDRAPSKSKALPEDGSLPVKSIRFPKRNANNTRKLAALLRVMDLTHEALVNDLPTTKRDMFYKDVGLFQKQAVVDKLVDDVAATFELTRSDFKVRASSKGLFAGSTLTVQLRHGGEVTGNDYEASLVPCDAEVLGFAVTEDIAWVLVVEKEAVFQTLCRIGFPQHEALLGPGIVMTGKGYPDVATRQLLSELSKRLPNHIPILALVDADPHGIDILAVYKFGSVSMEHERATLAAPRLEYIGVWGSELDRLNVDRDTLIPLSPHDYKKALAMLRREDSRMPPEWKQELTHMLHIRRKAEIEVIYTATASVIRHEDQDEPDQSEDDLYLDDLEDDLDVLELDENNIASSSDQDSTGVAQTDSQIAQNAVETLTGAPLLARYLAEKINASIERLLSLQGGDADEILDAGDTDSDDDLEEYL